MVLELLDMHMQKMNAVTNHGPFTKINSKGIVDLAMDWIFVSLQKFIHWNPIPNGMVLRGEDWRGAYVMRVETSWMGLVLLEKWQRKFPSPFPHVKAP